MLPAAAMLAAAGALLAYAVDPLAPLLLLAAVAAVGIAVTRPIAALYVAIALIPLELFALRLGGSGADPAGRGFGLSAPEAMLLLAGAGWAVRRLVAGKLPVISSPLTAPLILLLLAVVPGLAIADEPAVVAKVLIVWTCLFLVYQLILDEADPDTVRRLLLLLAASAAVVGLVATIGTNAGADVSLEGVGQRAEGRAEGSFGHPNTLASFEALALPGALALALGTRGGTRLLAAAAGALAFAGLVFSLSRGGLLAAGGMLGVMVVWAPFRRVAIAAAIVVAVFAVVGANPLGDVRVVDTVTQRVSSIQYSAQTNQRLEIWAKTPDLIADHPLLGVGAVQFSNVAPRYGIVGTIQEGTFEHAHNIPLTIAAELGLLGLAGLVWFAVAFAGVLVGAYRRSHGLHRGLAIAIAAAMFALTLQGMVDYALRLNLIVGTVLILAGCAVVIARAPKATEARATEPDGTTPEAPVTDYAPAAAR